MIATISGIILYQRNIDSIDPIIIIELIIPITSSTGYFLLKK